MDLMYPDEHKSSPSCLADFLPWSSLIAQGVILNKDGSFQATATFRGHDLESSTPEVLTQVSLQMNNVLARFGSNWCLHIEARRRPALDYPDSTFPTAASWIIDAEREDDFRSEGRHFENDYFITFMFRPPEGKSAKLQNFMFDDPDGARSSEAIYSEHLAEFENHVDQAVSSLRSNLPMARRLTSEETLSYLNSCVSNRIQRVEPSACPVNLDYALADTPLVGGMSPRLGDRFIKTIGFRNYPESSTPGLLDQLNRLAIPYRWVVRFLPVDHDQAEKFIKNRRKHWFNSRFGIGAIFQQAINPGGTPGFANPDAVAKAQDCDDALREASTGYVAFGYITPTITVSGATEDEAIENVRLVTAIIERLGFTARVEDMNAVDAWLGSLPGEPYADKRRPFMSSLNVSHVMPLSAVWGGPVENRHLGGPPLMQTKAEGNTPFRLDLHQGDVGHTQIFGPTGGGKSVLLGTLCSQFLRYDDAQVYIVDMGRSSRCLTLANNGDFFDLGDSNSLAFQPLRDVDKDSERQWALEWVLGLCEANLVTINPEAREAVWTALTTLSGMDAEQRTIGMLRNLIQHDAIKDALRPYASANNPDDPQDEDGPYAYLLDARTESLNYSAWQAFELEELTHMKHAVAPVLEYLFHRLDQRFDGKPTLLVLDEAWLFLDSPRFAQKIREWLKVLRKRNVSVVFATQQLSDVVESNIAAAVFENCPTAIYLPNPAATNERVRGAYERMGLNDKQIENIARSVGKRDYYYVSQNGSRMFQLGLREGSLKLVASSSPDEQRRIDEILAAHGPADFVEHWFAAHGLTQHAKAARDFNAALDDSAPSTSPEKEKAHAIAAE